MTQTPSVTAGAFDQVDTHDQPISAPTDEALLARFLRGEPAALGLLAQRHELHLLGLASGLLNGRRDLAADAVQETWLRVIKYGKSFRSGAAVKTWLYRILVNTCKDTHTQANRFRLTSPERKRVGALDFDPPSNPPTDDTLPNSRIRSAIESLSGDHRLIILLCYHQGLTHPQAADVLDIPVGTLKSRLNAALTKLRENLGEDMGHSQAHSQRTQSRDGQSVPGEAAHAASQEATP